MSPPLSLKPKVGVSRATRTWDRAAGSGWRGGRVDTGCPGKAMRGPVQHLQSQGPKAQSGDSGRTLELDNRLPPDRTKFYFCSLDVCELSRPQEALS